MVTAGKVGSRRSGSVKLADTVLATYALGPVGLLAAAGRAGTGLAIIALADGITREKGFRDTPSLARAQAEAVQFDALAAQCEGSAPVEPDRHEGTGVAAELERLAALHASGILDD